MRGSSDGDGDGDGDDDDGRWEQDRSRFLNFSVCLLRSGTELESDGRAGSGADDEASEAALRSGEIGAGGRLLEVWQ